MKKYFIYGLLILTSGMAACNKDKGTPIPTEMTTVWNGDSLWTTTNVTTDASNAGLLFITGKSPDGTEKISLSISDYKGRPGTFEIDYSGTGGNTKVNMGQFTNGTEMIVARVGKVVIDVVTNTFITGKYELHYMQEHIIGTFTAPTH